MKTSSRFRTFVLTSLLMAVTTAAQSDGGAVGPKTKQRVVFQVSDNDPARWHLVLNNAQNLQNEIGKDNVEVAVVAFGPGIHMLRFDSEVSSRLDDLGKRSVFLIGCQNSIRGQNLTIGDMHQVVEPVSSGVAEIVKKQWEGWAYIRP